MVDFQLTFPTGNTLNGSVYQNYTTNNNNSIVPLVSSHADSSGLSAAHPMQWRWKVLKPMKSWIATPFSTNSISVFIWICFLLNVKKTVKPVHSLAAPSLTNSQAINLDLQLSVVTGVRMLTPPIEHYFSVSAVLSVLFPPYVKCLPRKMSE